MAAERERKKSGARSPERKAGGSGRKGEKASGRFDQILYHAWCKACGICAAFCPVHIIGRDACGRPVITDSDKCVGCRFCELHCPDFAITILERGTSSRKRGQVPKEAEDGN